jgi:hypothetical protein
LENGDIEADYCNDQISSTNDGSLVEETTPDPNPQVVWQMTVQYANQYRAFREPSPYPGVTWSADALHFQAEHASHPKSEMVR